jgi:hypothetical protein
MTEQKDFVTDVTENVEQTTEETQVAEQPVKTYTEEELNEIVGKRVSRREAKIRKEYDRKYGNLERTLRAGTGKENVEEMESMFREFYEGKGINIPSEPTYNDREMSILAQHEANEFINAGFDEVVEEVDRLADIGLENMNARERQVFKTLAEYRQTAEQTRELAKIGVTEDVYNSKEFKDFAQKFSNNTPISEVYDIFNRMQPKKEIRTMGSMRTNTQPDKGVKEFYTIEEARQFTKQDFDKNPELFKAVERSMLKW